MTAQSIYLIGPMGAGKTTVGRRLAQSYGLPFVDLDAEIVQSTGAPIDWIFDIEGEAGFRDREHAALFEVTDRPGALLVATGGGVILRASNRQRLAARGLVVYLATSVDQQIKRLSQDKSRPLMPSSDRRMRLEELSSHRNPLYASIADLTVATTGNSVRTAREVIAAIERFRSGAPAPEANS